jgi:hypothetical protein
MHPATEGIPVPMKCRAVNASNLLKKDPVESCHVKTVITQPFLMFSWDI